MCHLYHHHVIPIMLPREHIKEGILIKSYVSKSDAEITNCNYKNHTELESWSDCEMARDVLTTQSTTSVEHTFYSIYFA